MDIAASAAVETKVYATMRRGDHEVKVLVGGGTAAERADGVKGILAWNRWAAKDSKEKGIEFPGWRDAPRHMWQLKLRNVRAILERGNV
jgi:hypothetical protein